MKNVSDFSQHIPANKFSHPRLTESRILVRSSLFEEHLQGQVYQYVIIEAQAGQGKTTTAIQFVTHTKTPFLWYQFRKEDRDPLYFLSALVEGLKQTFPEFSCPRLTALLQNAELTQRDIARPVNLILADLKQVLSGDFTFVFDDLHLIADAAQSLEIVDYMLETVPGDISFYLISRKPLAFSSKRLRFGNATLFLGNEDLAFSKAETGALFEKLQNHPAEPQTISSLADQTGGWVMGVVLAADSTKGSDFLNVPSLNALGDRLAHYFEDEFFGNLDATSQQTLIKLALLDDIDVELAREITGQPEIEKILLHLMDDNCFIRSLDNDATLFSIHQLFLGLLRSRALQLLSPAESGKILSQAASYYLKRGMLAQGLNYLLRAEAYSELEEILSRRGMEMVFMNRLLTLASVLEKIPPERIQASAWFSVFSAFVVQKSDPASSLELFLQARQLFQKAGHSRGELVVLGELIYYFVVLSPDSNRCKEYLDSANDLFTQCGTELPSFCQANTAKNLGAGCFYFLNDFPNALNYIRIAEMEAEKAGSPSQLLEILVAHGLIHLYAGENKRAEVVAEHIFVTMNSNDCGVRGLAVGFYFFLQMLHLKGNYRGYYRLKLAISQKFDLEQLKGSIVHSYIILYDISIAAAQGKPALALSLIDEHIDSGFFVSVRHLRNEMLATQALTLAQNGEFEPKGREVAETLVQSMEEDSTPGYRLKLLIPLALAFAIGGDLVQARKLVDSEIELAHKHTIYIFEMYGRLLRVFIATLDGNMETARADLQYGLESMDRQGLEHIRCFSSTELRAVLQLAVELDVYSNFAVHLAADHLDLMLKADGSAIPILSINTLGSFELQIDGHVIGGAADFTATQRQLFGLLISHPQMEISQEQVQCILWPDSSLEKGRNRFDALLSRMRKVLAGLLPDYPVKDYLLLAKGILSLKNCRIDARIFSDAVKQGLILGQDNHWWQAGSFLASALELWSGSFAADLLPGEEASDYGWELQGQLTKLGLAWCPQLAKTGQLDNAILIATKIWKENSADEQLTTLLYTLHILNKDPLQAKRLYKKYRKMLEKDGYPEEEIRELLDRISAADTGN